MDKYMKANAVLSKFTRNYMELKKDLPIRPSEMAVLNIITKRGGMYTPIMIADLLGVSKPMITAHISALQKKGYIRKEESEEDKRSFYVVPTKKAVELTDRFEVKQAKQLERMEVAIGKDGFEELITLVEKVLPVFEKMWEEE